ncbi:MAG: ANTAR domain-containing protein [Bacillota bacterium]
MVGIIIATDDRNMLQNLHNILARNGYGILGSANSAFQVIREIKQRRIDLLILDNSLPGYSGMEFLHIVATEEIPVVMLVNGWQTGFSELTRMGQISSVIVKPITENNLLPAVDMALGAYQEIKRLKTEIENLKNKIETRKLVEKAKGILMKKLGLSEEEAFRRMQKQSMNQSLSMKAVAQAIISSHDLFK